MVSSITNCLHWLHSVDIVWHSPCHPTPSSQKSLLLTNFVLSRLLQSRYITSMYFIFTTLTSVGFGNVAPNSSLEKLTSIMVMLLGCKSLLLSTHLAWGTHVGTLVAWVPNGVPQASKWSSSTKLMIILHDVAWCRASSCFVPAQVMLLPLFALFGSSFPSPENGRKGLKCFYIEANY